MQCLFCYVWAAAPGYESLIARAKKKYGQLDAVIRFKN